MKPTDLDLDAAAIHDPTEPVEPKELEDLIADKSAARAADAIISLFKLTRRT